MKILTLLAVSCLAFSTAVYAEPSPPGAGVSVTPPAPAAPPVPGAVVPTVPPVARREDTELAPAGSDLSLIQRAIARVSGIPTDSALAQQVATLTAERTALQTQVATLNTQVATVTAERDTARAALAQHQADLAALQAALDQPVTAQQMQTPAGQAAATVVTQQVSAHLRSLSHPAANLPAQTSGGGDPAATRPDNLREAFRAETDPVKKSALFRQLRLADAAARSRSN